MRAEAVARHLGENGREAEQHQSDCCKGKESKEPGGLPFPAAQQHKHCRSAEEKRVEHKVILRHEPKKNTERDAELRFPAGLVKFFCRQQRHKHREETHQHIHADHQHGAETDLTEPVKQNHAGCDPFGPEELQSKRIEQDEGTEVDDQVRNQADPLGKVSFRQGGTEVQKPVIQRRMDIPHLVVIYGPRIKTRFSVGYRKVVKEIFAR